MKTQKDKLVVRLGTYRRICISEDAEQLYVLPNRPLDSVLTIGRGQILQTHKRQSSSTKFTQLGEKNKHTQRKRERQGQQWRDRREERLRRTKDPDPNI